MNPKQAPNNRFNVPIFSPCHESSAEWAERAFFLEYSTALAAARWFQSGINLHPCSLKSRKRQLVFASRRYVHPWKNCIYNLPLWDSTNRDEQSNQTTFFWQKYLLSCIIAMKLWKTEEPGRQSALYFFISRFAIYSWKAEQAQLSYYSGICACLRNFWTTISQVLEFLSCLNFLFSVPAFWAGWVRSLNLLLQDWLYPLKEAPTFTIFF